MPSNAFTKLEKNPDANYLVADCHKLKGGQVLNILSATLLFAQIPPSTDLYITH
jgi:hypothetical protein